MTKYTDEEIIGYLRTLREGDVLTAVKTDDEFYTKDSKYTVHADIDNDLFVRDNENNLDYVRANDDYDVCIADLIRKGVFEIPTPAADVKPFKVRIVQAIEYPQLTKTVYNVALTADAEGLAKLQALEFESEKAESLAILYGKRAEIQADIDRLEAK